MTTMNSNPRGEEPVFPCFFCNRERQRIMLLFTFIGLEFQRAEFVKLTLRTFHMIRNILWKVLQWYILYRAIQFSRHTINKWLRYGHLIYIKFFPYRYVHMIRIVYHTILTAMLGGLRMDNRYIFIILKRYIFYIQLVIVRINPWAR